MPVPVAPIIAGAASLIGDLFNSSSQESINRQNIAFQREMYGQQQKDYLRNWSLQNSYNSPQEQMRRFQQAGLNPNLIYGQGNPGNSGPVPTPDVQAPELRSPEWGNALSGGLGMISAMYDLDIKAAQADNLQAQNTVIEQDALLRAAQLKQTEAQTERSVFDLGLDTELRGVSADARKEQLRQLKVNTDVSIDRNTREIAQSAVSVNEAIDRMKTAADHRLSMRLARAKTVQEIESIKQERDRVRENISLLKQQGVLNDLDIELKKKGIMPHDPLWARIVGRLLDKFFTPDGSLRMPRLR